MEIFKQFDITPNNIEIYNQAFCHSSYANEHNVPSDYERLEFLGDTVLDLVVSEYLYNNTDISEGSMTKIRSNYVCENALYEYAKALNFSEYIKVGKGEEASGGKERKTTLADTFEAFIGALYIDQGFLKAREFIYKTVIPHIRSKEEDFFVDYKSLFQELVQTEDGTITYELVKEKGPSHNKEFIVQVKVDNIVLGKGIAKTKKEAEQNAAKDALNKKAKL